MSVLRFLAVILVFGVVSIGWCVLGANMTNRTQTLDRSLSLELAGRWGPEALTQVWPQWVNGKDGSASPSASKVQADIRHENRHMGLLWYSTFTVTFKGSYTLAPLEGAAQSDGQFIFPLPFNATRYHDLQAAVDDRNVPVSQADVAGGKIVLALDRQAPHVVTVTYVTTGQSVWVYAPVPASYERDDSGEPGQVYANGPMTDLNDFSLTVTTDFTDIDYPKGSASPTKPALCENGRTVAVWEYPHAITRQAMGVVIPTPTNAGPVAARMSFFAPVSLAFFFAVLFAVVVLRKIPLHPMHYLFIAAGFFAFHLLLAYLVDLIDVHLAFWISAGVSVALVVSYMRLVAGVRFAVLQVGAAQLVFLVGFSYAFFWVGKTGLAITVGAILTLFVMMQATGRVQWHRVFAGNSGRQSVPPPLPPSRTGAGNGGAPQDF